MMFLLVFAIQGPDIEHSAVVFPEKNGLGSDRPKNATIFWLREGGVNPLMQSGKYAKRAFYCDLWENHGVFLAKRPPLN